MDRQCWGNVELEDLWAYAPLVCYSVLGNTGGSFTLATSLPKVAEDVENSINTTAANGVW
jgi:hypothetical protein